MRILMTTRPVGGHFNPLVPLAGALVADGHEVAFACASSFHPVVEAAGFRAFPAGFAWQPGQAPLDLFPQVQTVPVHQRRMWVFSHVFVDFEARQMVPDLLAIARSWEPDVIVREAQEFGGPVAAEVLGIPHAIVRAATWDYSERLAIAAALDELRVQHGLPPDPAVEMLYRYLFLNAEPPGFHPADAPLPPTAHPIRPVVFDNAHAATLPTWVGDLPDRPTVYATLGTVFNRRTEIFAAIIEVLRDERVNLIVTVGRDQDPAQFGAQPSNVHIERYVPQSLLLPRCDLVITHGGWNTTVALLAHGLPAVFIPLGADMPINARRCAALGLGGVVEPSACTPAAIRDGVGAILSDPSYRARAARMREDMAALPGPAFAVELVERLAKDKTPIIAPR
ncbi:MAG: glycosyltransferase [Chloroflexota bacterium]|nr:glycosyltransferase [Chloroflexota bacterium]